MSNLHSDHPVALQALLDETLFAVEDAEKEEVFPIKSQEKEETAFVSPTTVEQRVVADEVKKDQNEDFSYKGNRHSRILFLIRNAEHEYFSPEAEEAFGKILKALQLTWEDVTLLNLAQAHNPADFRKMMQFFTPKKIALLGVGTDYLKLPQITFNTFVKGKMAVVFNTFDFESILDYPAHKKEFWTQFKAFIDI